MITETDKAAVLINQFNNTLGKWISCLDDYTLEMLCQKPSIQSWSLGQVYVHIAGDTDWFVQQVKACLMSDDNSVEEMHPDAKVMFANNAFPGMLIEGPPSNLNVPQPVSKAELLQSLVSIKNEVDSFCSADSLAASTGKTRHPGLLFFNAMEWLQFAEMHMRHHFRQKQRLDDALFNRQQPS